MSAPSAASRRQIARPIPREPPVMSAVFPLSESTTSKLAWFRLIEANCGLRVRLSEIGILHRHGYGALVAPEHCYAKLSPVTGGKPHPQPHPPIAQGKPRSAKVG